MSESKEFRGHEYKVCDGCGEDFLRISENDYVWKIKRFCQYRCSRKSRIKGGIKEWKEV